MRQFIHNTILATKNHFLRVMLSLSIVFFFAAHVTGIQQWGFINALENLAYDARINLTLPPQQQDPRIVIVDIDEKSLKEIGRWPWSRDVLGEIIVKLFDDYGVSILGFDAVFPERDQSSGLPRLQALVENELKGEASFARTLKELEAKLDYDGRFASSLMGRRVVLGYAFTNAEEEDAEEAITVGVLPPPVFTAQQLGGLDLPSVRAVGYASNLEMFAATSIGSGHFNSLPDTDGITRRVPMLYQYEDGFYEALSLAMMRIYLGVPNLHLDIVATDSGYVSLEHIGVGNRVIPLNNRIEALIPFRGPRNSFPYVSAVDVLEGEVDKTVLQDALVLIGTTAHGLFDLRATPVEEVYPGVEIHANLLSGILDNRFLAQPAYTLGAELFILAATGLLMLALLLWLSPFWATLSSLSLTVVIVTVNLLFWTQAQWVVPLAATLLMMLTLFLFNMSYGYFVESRGKRELTGLFGQYVPAELVDEMSKNPTANFSMEGESREMTVLFSDVRGFTNLSEGLEPKDLSRLMNTFLTPMTRIIHEYRGTIDKYMGDAIMAFWGAPLADPKHPRNAVEAALKMIEALREINPQLQRRGWPEIRIGVGINTGMMSVGNMGSEFRMAYTVLGDAVNLGSRLEGLTKQYGVPIIVNETTKAALPDYSFRELDKVRVKGKDLPVSIFAPLGPTAAQDDHVLEQLETYHEALRLYREQAWDEAEARMRSLQLSDPEHKIYQLYLERIDHFRQRPPSIDWDGVFTHTTK